MSYRMNGDHSPLSGIIGIFKGINDEKLFRAVTLGPLIFFVLFFICIIFSIFLYCDPKTLLPILTEPGTVFSIKLSLVTATVSTIMSMIIGIPAAYAISKTEFFGKSVVDTILDLPIVVSPIALGVALLIFFNTPLGVAMEDHGIKFVFNTTGIILAQFTVVSALCIRLMKSTFDGMNPRYEEVARTLGCGKFDAFFKVTLPLSKNGAFAAGILTWGRAIGEFGATVTLAGATKLKTDTLPTAIFMSLETANVEKGMAIILILISISMVVLTIARKVADKEWSI